MGLDKIDNALFDTLVLSIVFQFDVHTDFIFAQGQNLAQRWNTLITEFRCKPTTHIEAIQISGRCFGHSQT